MRFVLSLLAATLAGSLAANAGATPTPITLDQAMANPDWIGNPVEAAWWGWDSRQVYFKQKRAGSPLRDTFQIAAPYAAKKVDDKQLANLDSADPVYNRDRTRAILLRNGDLFERDLKTGALTQILRGTTPAADPQYAADGAHVQFRVASDWFSWSRSERLVSPVALLRTAKDPDAAPDADTRRDLQLRLMSTLARLKEEKDATRDRRNEERGADPPARRCRSTWATKSPSTPARCRRTAATCWWSPAPRTATSAASASCRATSPNRATRKPTNERKRVGRTPARRRSN
jgi:hypothetical protein